MRESLGSFIIVSVISVALWYRNIDYDRVSAVLCFTLGLLYLMRYGVLNAMDKIAAAKSTVVLLWTQCFLFNMAAYLLLRAQRANVYLTICSLVTTLLYMVAAIISVIYVLTHDNVNLSDDRILLGVLYFVGLLAPIALMSGHLEPLGLAVLGLYILIGFTFFIMTSEMGRALRYGNVLIIGFAFLSWMVGILGR